MVSTPSAELLFHPIPFPFHFHLTHHPMNNGTQCLGAKRKHRHEGRQIANTAVFPSTLSYWCSKPCSVFHAPHFLASASRGHAALLPTTLGLRTQGDEDDPETGVQSSFRVDRPTPPRTLTLFRLREMFPFEGTFHFRIKVC